VKVIDTWKKHFAATGVSRRDIESYSQQIDRPFLLQQRTAFATDNRSK
jgi:serine/threonine-protein kinase HipA